MSARSGLLLFFGMPGRCFRGPLSSLGDLESELRVLIRPWPGFSFGMLFGFSSLGESVILGPRVFSEVSVSRSEEFSFPR